jgi:shikimate kinase
LSKTLSLTFIDSDHEIEARTGADIPWIFDVEGEAGFRRREKVVIDELTRMDGIVLATGGGAVLDEDSRKLLASRGHVVHLRTTVDEQLKRTAHDRHRPLLHTEDPRRRLEGLMQVREPLYREIADISIDTDGRTARSVAKEIVKRLEEL